MKHLFVLSLASFLHYLILAQDPWKLSASSIDPNNYYGITVVNGMIGIESPLELCKIRIMQVPMIAADNL